MLINYEVSEPTVMDNLSMLHSRRAPNGSSSAVNRPNTSTAPERTCSAASRHNGPASRVYRNMQRQIYKLWYDQAIPPSKALAYLRGRASSNVMFTISGHPVHMSSTSLNLQSKTTDATDFPKSGLPDMRLCGAKGQSFDVPSAPVSRSPFRETSKKNLLSPSYYAASSRENHPRRHFHNQETLPITSNNLVVNAQSVSPSSSPSVYPGHYGGETTNYHADGRPEKGGDVDEVDGSPVPFGKLHNERSNQRCDVLPNEKASSSRNELDLIADGIIITNAISHHKNNGEDSTSTRANTATLNSLNRRTRPFSSMTSASSKHGSRSNAGDYQHDYPDPYAGGPTVFQQRIMDLAALESETLRWERMKASRRKVRTCAKQD